MGLNAAGAVRTGRMGFTGMAQLLYLTLPENRQEAIDDPKERRVHRF